MNNFTYQPTPMEASYAYYLIRTVFPSSFHSDVTGTTESNSNNNNSNNTNSIHISGKYMVPFLSKSNISRPLLRDIWSLIDPNAVGYISTIQPQFMTILRYISIIQNSLFLYENNNNNDSASIQRRKESLQQCIIDTCHRTDLTLAQFEGYSIPPPHELILAPISQPFPSMSYNINNNSNTSSSSSSMTIMETYQNSAPTMDGSSSMMMMMETMVLNPTTIAAAPVTHITPTTTTIPSTVVPQAQPTSQQPDPFASILSSTTNSIPVVMETSSSSSSSGLEPTMHHHSQLPQQQQQQLSSFAAVTVITEDSTPTTTTMDVWGAFDALTTVVDAPLPTLSMPQQPISITTTESSYPAIPVTVVDNNTTTHEIVDDEDDFGDFHDISAMTDTNTIQNQPDIISTAPVVATTDNNDESASDGFGDFIAPSTTVVPTSDKATVQNNSGWDALDALVDETNNVPTMLMPISMPSPVLPAESNTTTTYSPSIAMMDLTTTTTTTSSSVNTTVNEIPIVTDYNSNASTSVSMQQFNNVEWDVLQSMPTISTTNKNPLCIPPSINDPLDTPHIILEDDSDGFGDFVSPNEDDNIAPMIAETSENGWNALDALVASSTEAEDKPHMPILHEATGVVEQQGENLFNDFVSPSMTGTQQQDTPEEDTFASTIATNDIFQHTDTKESLHEVQQELSIENGWDALNALASVSSSDIPLPPLQPLNHHAVTKSELDDTESEGFGDFVSPDIDGMIVPSNPVDTTELQPSNGITVSADKPPNMESGWDALDALASTTMAQATPIPSIQTVNHIVESNEALDDDNEGFSDFVTPSCDETNNDTALSREFTVNPQPTARVTSLVSGNTHASSDPPNISENGWDALDALVSTSDIPIPPLQPQTNESESEGFGDFIGTTDGSAIDDVIFDDATRKTEIFVTKNSVDAPLTTAADTAETTNATDSNDAMKFDLNGISDGIGNGSGREGLTNENLPQGSNWIAGNNIDDDFGEFIGDEGDVSALEFSSPPEMAILQPEPNSNGISTDPFDFLNPPEQAALSRPIIMYDRADSAYYSAQAKSVSSDSDYNNFEDAAMNETEFDNFNGEKIQVDATNLDQAAPETFPSDGDVDSSDPFTALSDRSAFEPSLFVNQQFTNELNFLSETDNTEKVDGDDFDAFTDFQGMTDGAILGIERKEVLVATNRMSDHTDIPIPNDDVPTNFTDDVIDDDFGEFEAVSSPVARDEGQIPNKTEAATVNDDDFSNFDDFGAFETSVPITTSTHSHENASSSPNIEIKAGLVVECVEDWMLTRDQIVQKAEKLPKTLRQTTSGMVDFGACFDANIQQKLPLSESRIHQIIRTSILTDRLTSSYGEEISTYWVQLLQLIKKELLNGTTVLQDATALDRHDLSYVVKSLKVYVSSLTEFVRVSRCIIATVADLLMLDVFTMLSNETLLSSFQSNNLAIVAYEIEQLWEKIYTYDERLCLSAIDNAFNRLEDMVEIRSRLFDNVVDAPLCDFTLQPLPSPIKIDSTQNVVTWAEKTYIVGAANLLSNTTDYFTKQSQRLQI